ncbi:MAG: hypothetical protein OEQ39_26935 [Gammaproteobacteria bacterium]|nr:hypothetical protein [Gammaproteobacteria bacterium]MDH3466252.1 hypothetical protein [Gammaproteobacteria bacterium]
MIVARWHVKSRFGMKNQVIEKIKQWWETIGKEIGQTDHVLMTGSVGAEEALVTIDVRVRDMAELQQQWDALAERSDHQQYAAELEPLIVSGSTRWEIFRVID